MKNKKYEMIGINKSGKVIAYKGETVEDFVENELLSVNGERSPVDMDEVVRDMDIFSDYTHYYRPVN